jgi:alpha-glucosidase
MNLTVKMLDKELWYGGSVADAMKGPFDCSSIYELDMEKGLNQTMPFFLSTMGRYIWCEDPMVVRIENGEFNLSAEGEIILCQAGNCIRDAYIMASRHHFPFSGKVPPLKFFETAQYNSWMELDYHQNQEDILKYAHSIVDNGYEPGVLMIDEGWHTRYGIWEWDFVKFPDPKAMIRELHDLGFKVMLWIVPMVTADGQYFGMSYFPYLNHLDGACGDKNISFAQMTARLPFCNGGTDLALYSICVIPMTLNFLTVSSVSLLTNTVLTASNSTVAPLKCTII